MPSYYGSTADGGRVYITVSLVSQSQANNNSAISWVFGWDFISSPYDRELDNGYVVIDGVARYNVPGRVRDYPLGRSGAGFYQVASGSFTVGHDANGYHTVAVDGHLQGYPSAYSALTSIGQFVLPRIPKPPGAPGVPGLSLAAGSGPNSRTINITIPFPSDDGGSAINSFRIQVATDSGFSNIAADYTTGYGSTFTGNYATTYYVRAWANNNIGTGPVSGTANIRTGADVPTSPTITAPIGPIGPTSVTVAWSPPYTNNGSAVTGYTLQCATDSQFANVVKSYSGLAGPSYTITGLNPSTTYYLRVSAQNAVGSGPYSPVPQFQTLPSVLLPNSAGTAWADAVVYIVSGGQWVPAQIKTRSTDGTAWA
jgi:hypothetical protein